MQHVLSTGWELAKLNSQLLSGHVEAGRWQLQTEPGVLALTLQALAQDQLRALRIMCEAAFGKKAPGVEVYDGDTAQVLRDSCLALVHSQRLPVRYRAGSGAGACHLAAMTGILSSAQKCPGCSRLSASLTRTGCRTRHAHVHRLCKASAVVRVTPNL